MLQLDAVHKRFGEVVAVDGAGFRVEAGTVCALIGPNGAGKSTTFRMITGLLAPDAGRIDWQDRPLRDALPKERIGFLPEERGLYQDTRADRVLRYWARLRGLDGGALTSAIETWSERLGLSALLARKVRELSKGNQQKLQLAACLVHDPALLVLDEPFSGLDPVNQDLVADLLRSRASAGAVVLVSAHQLALVERMADRVLVANAGRITALDGFGRAAPTSPRRERVVRLRLRGDARPDLSALPPHLVDDDPDSPGLTFAPLGLAEFTAALARLGADPAVEDIALAGPDLHRAYLRSVGATDREAAHGP